MKFDLDDCVALRPFTEMETRARIVDRERDQNSYFARLNLGF